MSDLLLSPTPVPVLTVSGAADAKEKSLQGRNVNSALPGRFLPKLSLSTHSGTTCFSHFVSANLTRVASWRLRRFRLRPVRSIAAKQAVRAHGRAAGLGLNFSKREIAIL
jgi:hypothetical protein